MWVKYCKRDGSYWCSTNLYSTNAIIRDLWSLQMGNNHIKLVVWTESTGRLCWPVCFWHDIVLWGKSRAGDVCSAKSKHVQFGFHWRAEAGTPADHLFQDPCLKAGSVPLAPSLGTKVENAGIGHTASHFDTTLLHSRSISTLTQRSPSKFLVGVNKEAQKDLIVLR